MRRIEQFPFFVNYGQDRRKAIIDADLFEQWLDDLNAEFLSDEDIGDRAEAFGELERGEALELKEAMKGW